MNNNDRYDMQKYSRATGSGVLRAAIAGYLAYLGYSIIHGMQMGESTMQPVLAWGMGIAFMVCAVLFAVYSYRRYKAELKAAEFPAGNAAEKSANEEQ